MKQAAGLLPESVRHGCVHYCNSLFNFALFSAHAEHVASDETLAYVLLQIENAGVHAVLIDTAKQQPQDTMTRRRVKSPYRTAPRSMVVISYRRRPG